jgi:hypothetical protein
MQIDDLSQPVGLSLQNENCNARIDASEFNLHNLSNT